MQKLLLGFNGLRCPQEGEINSCQWTKTTSTSKKLNYISAHWICPPPLMCLF